MALTRLFVLGKTGSATCAPKLLFQLFPYLHSLAGVLADWVLPFVIQSIVFHGQVPARAAKRLPLRVSNPRKSLSPEVTSSLAPTWQKVIIPGTHNLVGGTKLLKSVVGGNTKA